MHEECSGENRGVLKMSYIICLIIGHEEEHEFVVSELSKRAFKLTKCLRCSKRVWLRLKKVPC